MLGGDGEGASLGAGMRGRETDPEKGQEVGRVAIIFCRQNNEGVLLTCFIIRAGLPCHLCGRGNIVMRSVKSHESSLQSKAFR